MLAEQPVLLSTRSILGSIVNPACYAAIAAQSLEHAGHLRKSHAEKPFHIVLETTKYNQYMRGSIRVGALSLLILPAAYIVESFQLKKHGVHKLAYKSQRQSLHWLACSMP